MTAEERAEEIVRQNSWGLPGSNQTRARLSKYVRKHIEAAIDEEMEACAKIAVRKSCMWSEEEDADTDDFRRGVESAASRIAAKIRARGK